MNQKVTKKELTLSMSVVVITSSLMILGVTMPAINVATAEVFNSHEHESANKNGEHSNSNSVTNIGGKDGDHEVKHCIQNDNNDKGPVCHDLSKDR